MALLALNQVHSSASAETHSPCRTLCTQQLLRWLATTLGAPVYWLAGGCRWQSLGHAVTYNENPFCDCFGQ